jgi:hypothetical protein
MKNIWTHAPVASLTTAITSWSPVVVLTTFALGNGLDGVHLVADLGGPLELQVFGRRLHLRSIALSRTVLAAGQEQLHVLDGLA